MDRNKPRRVSPRESVEGPAKRATSKGDTSNRSKQGDSEKKKSKIKLNYLMSIVPKRRKYRELWTCDSYSRSEHKQNNQFQNSAFHPFLQGFTKAAVINDSKAPKNELKISASSWIVTNPPSIASSKVLCPPRIKATAFLIVAISASASLFLVWESILR